MTESSIEEMKAKYARVISTLRQYAAHDPMCKHDSATGGECTCGFDEADLDALLICEA